MAYLKPQCSYSAAFPKVLVQVIDSGEPLVLGPTLPGTGGAGPSGAGPSAAGPSGAGSSGASPSGAGASGADPSGVPVHSSSDEDSEAEAIPSGSSGRRIHYYADELRSMWNWRKVFAKLETTDDCIQFAEERGLIQRERKCRIHKRPMTLSAATGGQLGSFRCRKGNCRNKAPISRATGTWFENMHLAIVQIFQLMYAFSEKLSYHATCKELARETGPVLSMKTVADWFSYFRETVTIYELEHQPLHNKIGGPGKVVKIDESKFGKSKYNRGRHIEGHWVLGMIEDKSVDLRLEVCPDNERTAEILVQLIQKHVQEGSIIHTDNWNVYLSLPEHGYVHKRVNQSDPVNTFVAPDGTHTQQIESQWRGLKKAFRHKHNKKDFTDWLCEYSWRRKITVEHKDPFEELLEAVLYVYNNNE